jgi:recombination protein RecR
LLENYNREVIKVRAFNGFADIIQTSNLYFYYMNYGSKLVEEAVAQFASLPGIGRKTALRLVLHILKKDSNYSDSFASALTSLKAGIRNCVQCCNISDNELCHVCSDRSRVDSLICVVEDIRDVMAIEATGQFRGVYHVLGGVISPLEGVGPSDLHIEELISRLEKGSDEEIEIVMAISPTIDGETTTFYLYKLLAKFNVNISQISRGIAFGGELEYADEVTLGRSISARIPYSVSGKADS